MESLAPSRQEPADPRRRIQRLEQLDLALAGSEQRRAHVLVGDRRLLDEREPQGAAVEAVGVLEPIHDDADVVNASHHAPPLSE